MAKYYVDWEEIEEEDAPALIEAVARYISTTDKPDKEVIAAILGIKKQK